jgi:hypothetical protein
MKKYRNVKAPSAADHLTTKCIVHKIMGGMEKEFKGNFDLKIKMKINFKTLSNLCHNLGPSNEITFRQDLSDRIVPLKSGSLRE